MRELEKQLRLPLESYDTGELIILPMRDAVDRLSKANYGFLAPANKITWRVGGREGWNDVYEVAGTKPTSLGLHTYMFHGQPFTIDDAEVLINGRKEFSHGLFTAWAARFNLAFRRDHHGQPLPRELWPFRYVKTFANRSQSVMRPAYQMWDHRSSFVIAGVDRDNVDASVIPNWSLLWREFLRNWRCQH